MKKLTVLLMTLTFFITSGFAESTVSGNGFEITSTPSGATSVSALAPKPAPKPPVSIDQTMEVVAKTHHEEDAALPYVIDYRYPQITGEALSQSAKAFNHLVVDKVNQSVQQFKNYVKADMPHMQTLPDSEKHNNFHLDYTIDVVKTAKQTILSLRLLTEGMQAGRAHPYHTHQVMNFNLKTGKVLALKDLFKRHANYLAAFAKYSSHELNQKLQDKWMIKDGTAPLAKNYQLWNLKENGILLTFEEYQVGPYVAGSQEVLIPYSALKQLIAPHAPIPLT